MISYPIINNLFYQKFLKTKFKAIQTVKNG